MNFLIDTDVAIHWRDGDPEVRERVIALGELPAISVITRVELENGVYQHPALMEKRRRLVDDMFARLPIFDFTNDMAAIYAGILASAGASKRKTSDRMIAATAISNGLTLITMNRTDFNNVPRLTLEVWPSPAPSSHPPSAAPR